MIDLDAIRARAKFVRSKDGLVVLDAEDFDALLGEITALRASQTEVNSQRANREEVNAHAFSLYRHRLDPNRVVRLLTYNLTTQKYHVEFYAGNGAPCHLNGYIDYAEMQMMYDLHNPIRDFASAESP